MHNASVAFFLYLLIYIHFMLTHGLSVGCSVILLTNIDLSCDVIESDKSNIFLSNPDENRMICIIIVQKYGYSQYLLS